MTDFEPTVFKHHPAEELPEDAACGWLPDTGVGQAHERGAVSSRFIARTAIIGSIAAAMAAWSLGIGKTDGFGPMGAEGRDGTSHVEAKSLMLEPIELQCLTDNVWDVTGSLIKFQMQWNKRDIPQFGGEVAFGNPGNAQDVAKILLTTCVKDASKYNGAGTKISSSNEVDADTNYKKTIVKVPVDSIEVRATYPTGNDSVTINQYPGLKIGGGLTGVFGGGIQAACTVVTVNRFPDFCQTAGSSLDEWKRDFDSKAPTTAKDAVLNFVQKEGSAANWENTKLAFRDAYIQKAINETHDPRIADSIIVQFVDAKGNPTNQLPDFGKDAYAAYRKSGVLAPADKVGWVVDTSTPNFKIKKPAPYKPKFPLPTSETPSTKTPTPTGATR